MITRVGLDKVVQRNFPVLPGNQIPVLQSIVLAVQVRILHAPLKWLQDKRVVRTV